jgi:hypothetical protein
LNEARIAYGRLRSDRICNYQQENPEGTWFERVYPSAAFGCLGFLGGNFERQHSLMDTFSLSRGGHQIRLGVQATRTAFYNNVRRNREGTYRFLTDKLFNIADPSSYPYYFYIVQGPIPFDVANWATGFFIQDSWAVTGNLTLNYGVRYDLDPFFNQLEPYFQQGRYLHPIRTDTNNVAPRLGIAWSPFRDRRTVLRAGGGVYYDQSHGQMLATVMVNTVLVDRIINIDTSPSQSAALNPYHPDVATPRRILAEALARNTIPDVSSFPTLKPTVNDIIEDVAVPYTIQGSAGVQHDFGRGLAFSADFVYSRGRDQFIIKDTNVDENSLPQIVRPDSKYLAVYTHTNDGWYRSKSLLVQASYRPKPNFSLRVAYTLAKNITNTAAGLFSGGPYATNPFDYSEDEGPADNDIRHDLNFSGSMRLPWGIEASSILKLSSALPFSVTTPAQLDSDPWPDRPEPRNSRRGDGPFSWDARLTKKVQIGERVSATGFVEAFNLTNTVTHTGFNGSMNSSLFLKPNNALDPRRVQLGFRVDF